MSERDPESLAKNRGASSIEATYSYSATLRKTKLRYENGSKSFFWSHNYTGTEWQTCTKATCSHGWPLYRREALIEAAQADPAAPVYIVEGEKAADRVVKDYGLNVTCSGGANTWDARHTAEFPDGRDVVILRDKDDAGKNYADKVAAALKPKSKSVRVVLLSGLAEKGDPFDYQGTREQLLSEVAQADPWAQGFRSESWDVAELAAQELEDPVAYIGPGFCGETVNALVGFSNTGKTYLALWLARCIALGEYVGFIRTRQANVLFISCELGKRQMKARFEKLFHADLAKLRGKIHFEFPKGQVDLTDQTHRARVAEIAAAHGSKFIIIDSLSRVCGDSDENSNKDMGALLARMEEEIARPTEAAVMILHHTGKLGPDGVSRGARGASAILAVCRDAIELKKIAGTAGEGWWSKATDFDPDKWGFGYEIQDVEPEPGILTVEGQTRVRIVVEKAVPGSEAADLDLRKVIEFATASGSVSRAEVMTEMNLSADSAKRLLTRGKRIGALDQVGKSTATRYAPRARPGNVLNFPESA